MSTKLITRWRKSAEQFQKQVDEARAAGSPFAQMLAEALTLRACAKELEDEDEGLASELNQVMPIVGSARRLHDLLHANAGTTDEWPIDLIARDEDSAQTLVEPLGTLRKSLKGNQ
jgi:hypothetical protein